MICGETILVVDDEKGIRSLCRAVLEKGGFQVLEAGNGIEAREVFTTPDNHIELLVIDVNMPELNGPDLVQEILPQRPDLKVLYMTGSSGEDPVLAKHVKE